MIYHCLFSNSNTKGPWIIVTNSDPSKALKTICIVFLLLSMYLKLRNPMVLT